MNDLELDEILERWNVPPVPATLRGRVRVQFAALAERRRTFRPRWRLCAGALAVLGTVLLVVTQAFPQKLPAVHPPYTVDSEFITYDDLGAASVAMYSTSYAVSGKEIVLAKSFGDPLTTALWRMADGVSSVVQRLTLPFAVSPEQLEEAKKAKARPGFAFYIGRGFQYQAKSGPGCADGPVLGRENILGYPAEAFQISPVYVSTGRTTVWMAPDLACFALRITIEVPGPDGSLRIVARKQAVRVTLNP